MTRTRMISPDLPAELKTALDAKLQGFSRNEAAGRSALISRNYRDGGGSGTIRSGTDALAYALARMPATYAAVVASLNALMESMRDLAPASLLDVGAGPGTASWAAAAAFPSLRAFRLFDANTALRTLALELTGHSTRLHGASYTLGEARSLLAIAEPADLVIASYMIGELGEVERRALAGLLWARTRHTLLVVEPGTPAGYARIIAVRAYLIAAGAHVAAPCPHDESCPLEAPDWCHFNQRLSRSRAHMHLKGAEVPFEDERFAYVALTRMPPGERRSRVLAPPVLGKAEITAKLCARDEVVLARIPRRAKAHYAQARRWRWGETVGET